MPYPFSYRLYGYFFLPFAAFAVAGGVWLWDRAKERGREWVRVVLLFFFTITVSGSAMHLLLNLSGDYASAKNRYLSHDVTEGIQWVRENTPHASVFFASASWDTLFAQQTYRRVYVSMGWQTTKLYERILTSFAVYEGSLSPEELAALIKKEGITHLVISERERRSGTWKWFNTWPKEGKQFVKRQYTFEFDAGRYSFLHEVFHNNEMVIYENQ